MNEPYVTYPDLGKIFTDLLAESVISRSLFKDEKTDVTLFGFAKGQALTEHKSPYFAIVQVLKGELWLKLGDDELIVSEGSWTLMSPDLPHALKANTDVLMLLTMLRS